MEPVILSWLLTVGHNTRVKKGNAVRNMKTCMKCIVLTFVAVLVGGLVLLFVLRPAILKHETTRRTWDSANLIAIGRACWGFASEHDGRFPNDSAQLAPYVGNTPTLFVTREKRGKTGSLTNVMEWTDYVYIKDSTTTSPPKKVLAFVPPGIGDKPEGSFVLFVDGSVLWLSLESFQQATNSTRGYEGP